MKFSKFLLRFPIKLSRNSRNMYPRRCPRKLSETCIKYLRNWHSEPLPGISIYYIEATFSCANWTENCGIIIIIFY